MPLMHYIENLYAAETPAMIKARENIEKHDFAIRSEILDVMRTVDEAKLSEDSFRKELAEKLKMAINSVLEKYEDFGGVEEVLFTEFVVQ